MGTVITSTVLLAALVLIIRSLMRNKKSGKSIQCGGNCKNCNGHCHRLE